MALHTVVTLPKRLLVGRPMRSERMGETLLPKKIALPVFCSDPLSSNAYATEEILLVLSLGGLALLHLTWPIAAVVIALLIVVVASYRQTCHAYPNGGGAYAVSRANLGRDPALGRRERPARGLRADGGGLGRRWSRERRVGVSGAGSACGRAVARHGDGAHPRQLAGGESPEPHSRFRPTASW